MSAPLSFVDFLNKPLDRFGVCVYHRWEKGKNDAHHQRPISSSADMVQFVSRFDSFFGNFFED